MAKVNEFLKGKKSYIVAAITCILGFLQAMNIYVMPEWVYVVLASLFGISLRAGVGKVATDIKKK